MQEAHEMKQAIRLHIRSLIHFQSELITQLDHLETHGKVLRHKGGATANGLRELASEIDLDFAAAKAITD